MKKRLSVQSLLVVLVLLVAFPGVPHLAPDAAAMLIDSTPAVSESETGQRAEELSKIQGVLEAKVVQQRLADLGFSAEEISGKLNGLSDAQLHQVAQQLDSVLVGGFHGTDDLLHGLLSILLVVAAVVLILVLI